MTVNMWWEGNDDKTECRDLQEMVLFIAGGWVAGEAPWSGLLLFLWISVLGDLDR